jgi:hypothetical protein
MVQIEGEDKTIQDLRSEGFSAKDLKEVLALPLPAVD